MLLEIIYGLDYNKYCCGGVGNPKICKVGCETVLFSSESDMLKTLADLKKDGTIGEIKVFTSRVERQEYKI